MRLLSTRGIKFTAARINRGGRVTQFALPRTATPARSPLTQTQANSPRAFSLTSSSSQISSPSTIRTIMSQSSKTPTIALLPVEEKFLELLQLCCDWINETRPQPSPEQGGTAVDYDAIPSVQDGSSEGDPFVTTRIAGGWVRDKLLNSQSDDMDVSISGMSGFNFAILFRQFLDNNLPQESSSAKEAAKAMSHVAKISANPEQSKALETATANIFGLSVDFVNLRKEVYQGDSRIPTMVFGTPKEDAERRDICFNSLLYNVRSRRVEDWTGKGLDDLLRNKMVRTPLPPLTTFLDDPLRVLRCIRFASRFNYELHPDIAACLTGQTQQGQSETLAPYADDPRTKDIPVDRLLSEGRVMIRQALQKKVSRERCGVEIEKMMKGPFPLLAHALLDQLDMYSLVFHPDCVQAGQAPPLRSANTQEPINKLPSASHAGTLAVQASAILDALSSNSHANTLKAPRPLHPSPLRTLASKVPTELRKVYDDTGESRKLLQLTAALLAFANVEAQGNKKQWSWVGNQVMMQSLKLSKNLTHSVDFILRSVSIFSHPDKISLASHEQHVLSRPTEIEISHTVLLTLLLRDKSGQNPPLNLKWELSLAAALVNDLLSAGPAADMAQASSINEAYSDVINLIVSKGLVSLSQAQPILDGKELLATLDLKPSRALQPIQTALFIWQVQSSIDGILDGKDELQRKRMAADWIKTMWDQGKIISVDQREEFLGKSKGASKGKAK